MIRKIKKFNDWSISIKMILMIILSSLPFIAIFELYIFPEFVSMRYNDKKETLKAMVYVAYGILEDYDRKVKKE